MAGRSQGVQEAVSGECEGEFGGGLIRYPRARGGSLWDREGDLRAMEQRMVYKSWGKFVHKET